MSAKGCRVVSCRCHLDGGAETTRAAKSQSIREVNCYALHDHVDSIVCRSRDLHLMSCFATSVVRYERRKKDWKGAQVRMDMFARGV